ncbi:hypothetical protein BDY21DRAFT_50143 [Lineolata rhizophorae]|uniref:polynucleotide adenylyltransferase n=1 Tax=Lineolata rhizophorae TaxID=578093 RepID=A0A6A6NXF7_9PEZI|nr:hypothetical protein BDY21DRAFT_50143 [Lineolata rhizophorae]
MGVPTGTPPMVARTNRNSPGVADGGGSNSNGGGTANSNSGARREGGGGATNSCSGSSSGGLSSQSTPFRPPMTSHHSNSVPSTPHQYPRDLAFRSRSRSPSPAGLGSHSPRSVTSEANGVMPTLPGKPRQGCRFETNVAFGRRRMRYDIGADILPKAEKEPKKTLEPHEADKLSGDMRELYDRLLPSDDSQQRRKKLVEKLHRVLITEWPGNEFKVHVFGSSGNMLCTSESDVDVCIQTPMKKLETMHMLAEALSKHGMDRVVCVSSAKVPIVKIWDPELKLSCDMNVNNTLALENTRMIKTYVQIDDRVRPLAMIVKYWTKRRILNDAAFGGTISSYTWICMILNFLQTRNPPVIPALHQMPHKKPPDGEPDLSFADDLETLRGYGNENKESLGELLFQFFRRYAHELDYETHVISVRHGRLLSRKEKGWDISSLTKEGRDRLCVEEPFNTSRNLGNSADDTAWRGIHLELRRAFDLIVDGLQLDKCCEQYEYPPEENKGIFKKPASGPKPVLSQSLPHSRGRGGGGAGRGGRNYNQKSAHGSRRASSGETFLNRHQFAPSPPIQVGGADYFGRGGSSNIHELYYRYQLIDMQIRERLLQQSQQQAQAQAAHTHSAHMQAAQAHAQAVAQHAQAQARGTQMSNSPQRTPYVNGQPSPGLLEHPPATAPLMYGNLYNYQAHFEPSQTQSMAPSLSQEGSRTNPSSPSLSSPAPSLRRTAHRSSVTNGTQSSSIRSQSQPARVASNPLVQGAFAVPYQYDPATGAVSGYPMVPYPDFSQGHGQGGVELPGFTLAAPGMDHGVPKEYVGYYENSPQMPQRPDFQVPAIPIFKELPQQRRRRVSPEHMQSLNRMPGANKSSRSPSPLGGRLRSQSTGLQSTPLAGRQQQLDPTSLPGNSGLLIVNGSLQHESHQQQQRVPMEQQQQFAYPQDPYLVPSGLGQSVELSAMPMNDENQRPPQFGPVVADSNSATAFGSPSRIASNTSTKSVDYASPKIVPSSMATASELSPKTTLTQQQPQQQQQQQQQQQRHASPPLKTTNMSPLDISMGPNSGSAGLQPKDTSSAPTTTTASSAPLLSPINETQTPSPTASRRFSKEVPTSAAQQSQPPQQQQQQAPPKPVVVNGSTAVVNGRSTSAYRDEMPAPPTPASASSDGAKNCQQPSKGSVTPATAVSNKGGAKAAPKKDGSEQLPVSGTSTAASSPGASSGAGAGANVWQQPKKARNRKGGRSSAANERKREGEPMPANEADRKGG